MAIYVIALVFHQCKVRSLLCVIQRHMIRRLRDNVNLWDKLSNQNAFAITLLDKQPSLWYT